MNYVNLMMGGLPLYLFKIIYKLHSACFTKTEVEEVNFLQNKKDHSYKLQSYYFI